MDNVKIITGNLEITFHAAGGCDGYSGFGDQWEMVDDHQGGVTIKNPNTYMNAYPYAIPQQTTLAELSAHYAEQGRENPSKAAYDSLQRQLERDINAADYYITATVKHIESDTVLLTKFDLGYSFDHSINDDESLEESLRVQLQDSDAVTLVTEEIQRLKNIFASI